MAKTNETMKGYLMQERDIVRGEDLFIESVSPENNYGVVFEDDGETGYFYAIEKEAGGPELKVLDALHIYETEEETDRKTSRLLIVWSRDWKKCALILDGYCQALFDFEAQGGYNINEFPPPNAIWTQGERKLTDEQVKNIF